MSAATAPTPPAANGTTVSAAEYVRNLPPEEKQAAFLALLKEAIAIEGGNGLIPIDDEDGKPFGYFVPPNVAAATAARVWNDLPNEVRERLGRPAGDLDNAISADEMLTILNRAPELIPR